MRRRRRIKDKALYVFVKNRVSISTLSVSIEIIEKRFQKLSLASEPDTEVVEMLRELCCTLCFTDVELLLF